MDWQIIYEYRGDLLDGLRMTVVISLATIVISLLVGVAAGCARGARNYYLVRASLLYADVLRNIPVVVKLFIAYFILRLDALSSGILALSLHQSSYISDVVAAGIRSLPRGQHEAALSSGLSWLQTYRYIILPQALRTTLPPLTTQFIQVVKNSSTVMLISLQELTFMTQKIEHDTFRGMEAAIAVTAIYLCLALTIALSMTLAQKMVDRRYAG